MMLAGWVKCHGVNHDVDIFMCMSCRVFPTSGCVDLQRQAVRLDQP